MFALIIFSVIIALLVSPAFRLFKNYQKARTIGLPIVFSPFHTMSPIWASFGPTLAPIFRRYGLGRFVRYSGFRFYWDDRYYMHEEHGPALCIVTPSDVQIAIADAPAVDDMLARRRDFIKCPSMYKPLELFGPNVDTLNGEDWQRHRRLTTPPFNERNSGFVWKESVAQAKGMLTTWVKAGKDGVFKTPSDTMTLALHVLTAAGFGKQYAFEAGVTKSVDGRMSYRDALKTVNHNLFMTLIITAVNLPSSMLPKSVTSVKEAVTEFKRYMVEMVEEERASIHERTAEKDNLMSVLVRASEAEKEGGRNGLSNEEIYGNLFIYNLAGHDTTSNTLAYAVTLMATDLKLQAWLREELDFVFGDGASDVEADYEHTFPQLKRCMALMYETIRLYGPIIVIPKYVSDTATTLDIAGTEYIIPPNTHANINVAALNTLPKYWGDDTLTFRPQRWIRNSDSDISHEELFQPAPGVFVPWATGPRVCPGKKFAQVEFVAVISQLFRKHTASVALRQGESLEDGKNRVMDMVEDSHLVITLQMRHPEKVNLVWELIA